MTACFGYRLLIFAVILMLSDVMLKHNRFNDNLNIQNNKFVY